MTTIGELIGSDATPKPAPLPYLTGIVEWFDWSRGIGEIRFGDVLIFTNEQYIYEQRGLRGLTPGTEVKFKSRKRADGKREAYRVEPTSPVVKNNPDAAPIPVPRGGLIPLRIDGEGRTFGLNAKSRPTTPTDTAENMRAFRLEGDGRRFQGFTLELPENSDSVIFLLANAEKKLYRKTREEGKRPFNNVAPRSTMIKFVYSDTTDTAHVTFWRFGIRHQKDSWIIIERKLDLVLTDYSHATEDSLKAQIPHDPRHKRGNHDFIPILLNDLAVEATAVTVDLDQDRIQL